MCEGRGKWGGRGEGGGAGCEREKIKKFIVNKNNNNKPLK